MKRTKFIIALIGFVIISINAKDSYYYYNGSRIPLKLREDSVNIYTNDGHSIKAISKKSNDTSVTSIEYLIEGENRNVVQMSNRFYVQLYDSINDLPLLYDIVKETNTTILGKIPYMSDWYALSVRNSIIDNSLEMSNYFYETGLFKNTDPGFIFDFTPSSVCVNDSYFLSHQWNMEAINACDAWTVSNGSQNIKIAIIDKGIDRSHSEFNISNFINEYNCHTRTSAGYQVYTDHGTQVCGVISADHNHNRIAGVSPSCKIIPISYSSLDTSTVAEDLAAGFAWAVSHGADVINCSWGDQNCLTWLHSTVLESAIQNALINGRNGKGCIVVFAAGNQNSTQLDYPARTFSDIITVGASDNNNKRDNISSYGEKLDVIAPGKNIYTTDIDNYYITKTGTSFAAPHVSGIAGLILSVNPNLTQKEVADIIESTAQKVGGYSYTPQSGRPNGTWNEQMGYGLVDAYEAVMKAKDWFIQGPDYVCDTTEYHLILPSQTGDTVTWSVSNGVLQYPHYSIVGPANQDTVYVRCERMTPVGPPNPHDYLNGGGRSLYDQKLMVTISNGTTKTYEKLFREPQGETPVISASNSSTQWRSGSRRTFTISNCSSTPDNALRWEVRKIVMPFFGNIDTTFTYYTGRTLSYRAPSVTGIAQLRITAINTQKECDPNYASLSFLVSSAFSLNAYTDNGTLQVDINKQDEETRSVESSLNKANTYSLELWHNIYGCMRSQTVQSMQVQMDISGLPQGVYVLLLKENGNVIADTKVPL